MKFGVHAGLWMAEWTDEITPILKTVADLGYDGVEVSMLGMTEEKAKALNGEVQAHGLEITCTTGLSPEADVTSDDPAIREAGLEYLKWVIKTSAIMGARSMSGVVYGPWCVFDPANKAMRAKRSAEAFAKVDEDLKAHDVIMGIEAINRFETDLVNTAAEGTAMAKASGSDRVGVLLDTFHLNMEEKDVHKAIVDTGKHLVHFHVSDNDRGVPGSGHVQWGEVKNALDTINYDGWIVAEMFVKSGTSAGADLNIWRDIEPDETEAARQALENMRRIFA